MGFPTRWISWIREGIDSPTFSIMMNGSPTGFFLSNRGIRQGDCLSPYIFVMVMEFFSIHMEVALACGDIKPVRRRGSQVVSHLLYANDMLIFSREMQTHFKLLTICLEN